MDAVVKPAGVVVAEAAADPRQGAFQCAAELGGD